MARHKGKRGSLAGLSGRVPGGGELHGSDASGPESTGTGAGADQSGGDLRATDRPKGESGTKKSPSRGIICDHCKSSEFKVWYTTRYVGFIERVRICKTCGAHKKTREWPH